MSQNVPQICTASAKANMKLALKHMQYRLAVVYETPSITFLFRCVAKNSLGETDGRIRLQSKYFTRGLFHAKHVQRATVILHLVPSKIFNVFLVGKKKIGHWGVLQTTEFNTLIFTIFFLMRGAAKK